MDYFLKGIKANQAADQAGAYPSFCSMKRLGVFPLPLDGTDASSSRAGLPPRLNSWAPVFSPGWIEAL